MTAQENKDVENLLEKIQSMDKTIDTCQRTRQAVDMISQPATSFQFQQRSVDPTAGLGLARMVRSLAAGKGNAWHAAEWAEKYLGDSGVSKALSAGSGSAGGFLVPEAFSRELIEFLRGRSVVRAMGARVVPLVNGNLTLPKITGGSSATYIGESDNIALSEPSFGNIKLSARKLAVLCPVSNDLIRFSSPDADSLIRDDLVSAIAQAEDIAFIRGDGAGPGPRGLRFWAPAANLVNVNATTTITSVIADLSRMMLLLQNANVRMLRPGWLMAPRTLQFLIDLRDANSNMIFPETLNGRLRGYPIGTTTNIPINLAVTGTDESEIYFVDFADVVIGQVPDAMSIEVSSEAAYFDGSGVQSAFSRDQTVIRVIMQHDLAVRHSESVAVAVDCDWGA